MTSPGSDNLSFQSRETREEGFLLRLENPQLFLFEGDNPIQLRLDIESVEQGLILADWDYLNTFSFGVESQKFNGGSSIVRFKIENF